MTGLNTRPIVFAFYVASDSLGRAFYAVTPVFADVEAESAFASQVLWNGGINDVISEIKGTINGVLQNILTFGCYIRSFLGAGFGNTKLASCL